MSEFNPFELQNLTWERSDISIGAKSMMNRLRNAAGRKGKIQLRVKKWGKWVGFEKRMAQYHISELIAVGLVKREPVKGHSNYWIIPDVYGKYLTHAKDCTTSKEPFQAKTNVCRNVIFSGDKKPRQQPTSLPLVNEMLSVTGDRKSSRYWIGIVRKLPEDEIRRYLSHLNIAMNEKIISRPGAYLNSLILANHPEFRRSSSIIQSQSQQKKYVEPDEPEIIPASEEVAMAAIAEIKAKLYRKVG